MINGPIKETFVLNCPKCASHFKSSQLLEQHLKVEHNVSNYIAGFNIEDSQKNKIDSDMGMNVEDDVVMENDEEEGDMMMMGDQEDANDDADFEGPQETGQDQPYSGGQNVVSIT